MSKKFIVSLILLLASNVLASGVIHSSEMLRLSEYEKPKVQHVIKADTLEKLTSVKPETNIVYQKVSKSSNIKNSIALKVSNNFVSKNHNRAKNSYDRSQIVNVYFNYNSDVLTPSSKIILNKIAGKVSLYGFASPEGTFKYNKNLSKLRAIKVHEFLLNNDVIVSHMKFFGEINCNKDPEKYPSCRKVEVYHAK